MNEHLDSQLQHLHTSTGVHLDAILDLDAGLTEILTAAPHQHLGTALDQTLDFDAGLHAITPRPAPKPIAPYGPAQHASAVATLVASWDIPTRLAMRHHPAFDAAAVGFFLAEAGAIARDLDLDLDRAIVRAHDLARDLALARVRDLAFDLDYNLARASALAHELARASALDRALDFAGDRALGFARDLASASALARALNHELARVRVVLASAFALARARALARDLDHDLARVRDLAFDLADGLARDRDPALALALARDRDLAHDLAHDLARALARVCVRDLDRVRHDFTAADLRGTNLSGVALDRLRWSASTRWPSEAWHARAVRDSVEVAPGVFEIRGGTAQVPTDAVAL